MKKLLPVCLVIIFLFVTTYSIVYANHRQEVLGTETSQEVNFPAVTAGTGYILPDSPLYFLDKTFQSFKLLFARTSGKKAQVHARILGERMAELRVMESRNNKEAFNGLLSEISKEANYSAEYLKDAAAQGANVSKEAKDYNDLLALYRDVLKQVANQSEDEKALRIEATRAGLLESKITVEDYLTETQLAEEIMSDLDDELETQVLGVQTQAKKVEKHIEKMEKRADAMDRKAEFEEEKKLKLLQDEKKKKILLERKAQREKLKELHKKKMDEAREAAESSKEASLKYKEARQEEKNLKNKINTP